jgi:hypothetical protein
MAKLVAHLLATAALWVRIQTSLKKTKWATKAKEWPSLSSPQKNIQKQKNSFVNSPLMQKSARSKGTDSNHHQRPVVRSETFPAAAAAEPSRPKPPAVETSNPKPPTIASLEPAASLQSSTARLVTSASPPEQPTPR